MGLWYFCVTIPLYDLLSTHACEMKCSLICFNRCRKGDFSTLRTAQSVSSIYADTLYRITAQPFFFSIIILPLPLIELTTGRRGMLAGMAGFGAI